MRRPVVVVGAGIVGLATARALLQQRPGTPVLVLEKEADVGTHQTGHSSGVLHSGVYYRPGSLKAQLCVQGRAQLLAYLRAHDLPFRVCGKVIVATRPNELSQLDELERRGRANGLADVRRLNAAELHEVEPEVAGLAGLQVPAGAIVDYPAVARSLRDEIVAQGGEVRTGRQLEQVATSGPLELTTNAETIEAGLLINAAGLQSDRVARLCGLAPPCAIVPFRGEHYRLGSRVAGRVRGLVYPVPDPAFPFLGVHLTPRLDGTLEAGPNAVLALAREGYRRFDVNAADLVHALASPGLVRLAWRERRTSAEEWLRSLSPGRFLDAVRRLLPSVERSDLVAWGAGVRAQAVGPKGELLDDFLVLGARRTLHVLNAPSPAATSSLAIADYLVARLPREAE